MEIEKITGEGATVKLNPEDLGILAVALAGVEGQEVLAEVIEALPTKIEAAKEREEEEAARRQEEVERLRSRRATQKFLRTQAIKRFPDVQPVRYR